MGLIIVALQTGESSSCSKASTNNQDFRPSNKQVRGGNIHNKQSQNRHLKLELRHKFNFSDQPYTINHYINQAPHLPSNHPIKHSSLQQIDII